MVCEALQTPGLTLNFDKCNIKKKKLRFYGHAFSDEGTKPGPDKVRTITDLVAPTTVSEVRSTRGSFSRLCSMVQSPLWGP